MGDPFILLDDARPAGASDARLYRAPVEIVTARRIEDVEPALARIAALAAEGHDMAGYLAYEAGLAFEPRLAPRAGPRIGAAGPLVWFGAFAGYQTIPAAEVPAWLAAQTQGASGTIGPAEPQLSNGGYAQAFARAQEAIHAGDIYQVNLTFPLAASWRGDPLALYAAIRPAARAGYGGVIHDGSHWLLSFSPELFFALKDGMVTARPMKGTRPRGADAQSDAALAAELASSVKDRAENLMIVDLLRNDLSRIAQPGSVKVEHPFAVETYPTVHQMVTTIRARPRADVGVIDLIRALFPCGSITGAPKIRAMELIDTLERDPRGVYCGAIGRIDGSGPSNQAGEAAFNVAIRTLRLTPGDNGGVNGGGKAVMGVGSAVVADSDALSEWRECLVKGGFVRESAGDFDLIETMAFTPDGGIPLLELHLERIKASAAELGFSFDRHALRNAIQALCFDADAPARLRLVAARSGVYSLELSPLPAPLPAPARCAPLRLGIDGGDWRLRHKTSDRGFHAAALAAAQRGGADEAIYLREDGLITEGSFTTIFLERDGQMLTPPARLGLLPGVLRRSLIDAGRAVEADVSLDDLADGFFIGNALRGLVPARLY